MAVSSTSFGTVALDFNNVGRNSAEALLPTAPAQLDYSNDSIWRGGEHYFEGTHDQCCFVCGTCEDIIYCQTCSRSYHPHCMFPPLGQDQVPDVWFCPVCVGRNWHLPLSAIQTPPMALPSALILPTTPLSVGSNTVGATQGAGGGAVGSQASHDLHSDQNANTECESQNWRDFKHWKPDNFWNASHGYALDQSSDQSLRRNNEDELRSGSHNPKSQSYSEVYEQLGDGNDLGEQTSRHHAISSAAAEIPPNKSRRPDGGDGGRKSHPRKRSKYSDLPKDIEKALDLVTSHLGGVSRSQKSNDDLVNKSRALEQRVRIQEGEVLICRKELHILKQRLAAEVSKTEQLQAQNTELHDMLQDARAVAKTKDNEMKKWQNTLRSMMGTEEQSSTSP